MTTIPDLLAAMQHDYPHPIPLVQEHPPGTGYSVAGAFIRYLNEHGMLTRDDCHDLMMMPGNTPRYPPVGVVTDVLLHVNHALTPPEAAAFAARIVTHSKYGRFTLAWRALELALTQTEEL